jgi:hypothetical protein
MTSGFVGARLKKRRIEHKPKSVRKIANFVDLANVANSALLFDELNEIIDSIEAGQGIPDRFWPAPRSNDTLFELHQILHVHLGGRGSDAILYLVQYADEVQLLRTGSHSELQDIPRGSILTRAHGRHLTFTDNLALKRETRRLAERTKREQADKASRASRIKAGLLPKKRK